MRDTKAEVDRLIPTRSRREIPRGLSYPIGAEIVSRALLGSSVFDELSIHFLLDPWLVARQAAERLLFSCKHSSKAAERSRQWTDESGIPLFGEWQVNVYAVPAELRHRVRVFLIDTALPQARLWLDETAAGPREGELLLEFFLDRGKDDFSCRRKDEPRPRRS